MRGPVSVRWLLAVVVLGGLLAACGDDDGGQREPSDASLLDSATGEGDDGGALSGAAFVEAGPHAAGVTSLELASGARVQVWYPAAPDAVEGAEPATYDVRDEVPPALLEGIDGVEELDATFVTAAYEDAEVADGGPFPYVVYAHGFAAYPNVSSALTAHLASWGFVVAAPEVLSRSLAGQLGGGADTSQDDVGLLAELAEVVAAAPGPLEGVTDTDEQAVVGHSAGGGTAALMSGQPGVVTYVALSAGGSRRTDDGGREAIPLGDVPSLWITGSDDEVVELAGVEAGWANAAAPTRLLVVQGAGHNDAFTDICEVGEVPGGVVGLALEVGFPLPESLQALGLDGCVPEGLPSADGQALVHQAVTAQLRWAYGIDDEPVGLDEDALEQVGTPFTLQERLG